MAISDSTTLNDLIGQIVSGEAQSAAYGSRIMRNLVRVAEVPAGAGSIVVPRFNSVAVGALSEGVAPGSTTMSTAGVTLTPDERGTYIQISKRALHADPFSDLSPYGEQLGRALAADEDALILASAVPGANVNDQATPSNITKADLLEAIGILEASNAPGPYFAVFHPTSWAKLRAEIGAADTYASVGARIVEGFGEGITNLNGYVGSPFGIPCFISTSVPTIDGGATYQNLMFSKEAIGYGVTQDIGVDVDENVVGRAFDLMGWYAGDAATLVGEYCVALEDDVDG